MGVLGAVSEACTRLNNRVNPPTELNRSDITARRTDTGRTLAILAALAGLAFTIIAVLAATKACSFQNLNCMNAKFMAYLGAIVTVLAIAVAAKPTTKHTPLPASV